MTIKEKVKELHATGLNEWEIVDKIGAHKRYVHKIVHNIWNHGRKGREDKYVDLKDCEICGGKATLLHHKDFNNENDDKANLQPLCIGCHNRLHVQARKGDTPRYVKSLPAEKKLEIMNYFYSVIIDGVPGYGSGVLTKFGLTTKQFEAIHDWYDKTYGLPLFDIRKGVRHLIYKNPPHLRSGIVTID